MRRRRSVAVRLTLLVGALCLVYFYWNYLADNAAIPTIYRRLIGHDITACFATHGLCTADDVGNPRCVMSINKVGRLGNIMAQYATLLALARWNQRPAFMLPEAAAVLQEYFPGLTMPALSEEAYNCIDVWIELELKPNMRDEYRHIDLPPEEPLMLGGYPNSFTFYDHLRDQLRSEFRLHDYIEAQAQRTLRELAANRTSVTYVGVHARRTDYVLLMNARYKGVVGNGLFFAQAMEYFRSRYTNALFVVVSDDMEWCRENMNNSVGDIVFAGSGNIHDPINDLALLMQCNHSIITIGTYGYWAAYLVGGETVYLTNYTAPDSTFLQRLNYSTKYLPEWKPIAADLTEMKYRKQLQDIPLHPRIRRYKYVVAGSS